MTHYGAAEYDWFDCLEAEAAAREADLELNRQEKVFIINDELVARTRATHKQWPTVRLTVNDEAEFLTGDWRDSYDRMMTVVLSLNDPSGFDPSRDQFYPLPSVHFRDREWTHRSPDGSTTLTIDLSDARIRRYRNDWDRLFDPQYRLGKELPGFNDDDCDDRLQSLHAIYTSLDTD